MLKKLRLKFDGRIWVIVGTVISMVVITVAIYLFAYGVVSAGPLNSFFKPWVEPLEEIGAVFAAWVGGLALFVIAGAFVAIISLERPERGSFDARARILFRRQPGKHVDYIVKKIQQVLEHYAESTTIDVVIQSFDATEMKFRTVRENKTIVRSYIDDIETDYDTTLALKDVTQAPQGRDRNRLIYVLVHDDPVGEAEEFDDKISRKFGCKIPADRTCVVQSLMEFWIKAGTEPNTHTPVRYTQKLMVSFQNRCGRDVVIRYGLRGATTVEEHRLLAARKKQLIEIEDLSPGELAFDYRIDVG